MASYLEAISIIPIYPLWGSVARLFRKPSETMFCGTIFSLSNFFYHFYSSSLIAFGYLSGGNVCNLTVRTCNYVVKIFVKV